MNDFDELVQVFGRVFAITLGVMGAVAAVFVIVVVVTGFIVGAYDSVQFMRRWWRRYRRSQRKKDRE